ncbi:MAG: methyltransferase domain-containing protein [Candidatus Lokiarchaeota archaeon]|nr:methyltransferase domain-containing protein [Candidatus Lokiarchaeota archaeon]
MIKEIKHPKALIQIKDLAEGTKLIRINPIDNNLFIPKKSCKTKYSLPLIEEILRIKGPAYLCDEILREEDEEYVAGPLIQLLKTIPKVNFKGKTILDFGCGSGASTIILARRYPESSIVGLDLNKNLLNIAQRRADFYNLKNIQLICSKKKRSLPLNIPKYHFAVCNAVIEHLLPSERKVLIENIWDKLDTYGILFISKTPNRLSPIENHTTTLPFINYMPDKIAHYMANSFSKNFNSYQSWENLLKLGIRGSTIKEIFEILDEKDLFIPILIKSSNFNRNSSKQNYQMIMNLWSQSYGRSIIGNMYALTYAFMYPLFNRLTFNLFQLSLSLAIMKKEKL